MENSLLSQLAAKGGPLVRGSQATFYWEGDRTVSLISDLNDWEDASQRFRRLPSRLASAPALPLWSFSVTLPRDAYVEYFFRDPVTGERLLDPFNPRTVGNGFGGRNNFFYMPGAAPTPLAQRRADVAHGTVTRHMVPTGFLVEDGRREVHLYAPPVKERVPLLVVYDGTDHLKQGLIINVIDNLIAEGRIRPIALVLLQNGGRHRGVEYACSDAVINWLDRIILPLAGRELRLLNLRQNPGAYGVLGISFGALMSLYTGLRMPEIFGKVICQSGAFRSDGRDFAAVDLIRHGHAHERMELWMDVGRFDSLLKENRRMQPLLKKNGYSVTYREFNGGHNFTVWRNDLWRALEALFPA